MSMSSHLKQRKKMYVIDEKVLEVGEVVVGVVSDVGVDLDIGLGVGLIFVLAPVAVVSLSSLLSMEKHERHTRNANRYFGLRWRNNRSGYDRSLWCRRRRSQRGR